ncbi:hypothetical protein DB30_02596 [Enhygromyxa salina]|uniref:Uncharacterized protein n=1 Tax=Enhygromyxa salina TaxID=215803 RepID=A0A0C1ZK31_9BACT|nr:hypothetical protein DB30_02596 [Enhygromyxa salina]
MRVLHCPTPVGLKPHVICAQPLSVYPSRPARRRRGGPGRALA